VDFDAPLPSLWVRSVGRADVWVPFDAKQKSSRLLRSGKFSVFSFQFSEKDRGPIGRAVPHLAASGAQFRTWRHRARSSAPGGIGRADQSSRCAEKP
jgi:hypothetical protein